MIVIYKITSPSGKIYIGQTWDWYTRNYNYSKLYCDTQKYLYNSLSKYGFDFHKIEVLLILPKVITQKELNFYEIYWWRYYKDLGYEMLNIKEPGSKGKHSKETKTIIGEKSKQKFIDNPYLKVLFLESTRGKTWNKGKTNVYSVQTLEKMSKSSKTEKKLQISLNNLKNVKNRPSKIINQYNSNREFIREWISLSEASRYYNISCSNITTAHKKGIKICNSYWKLKE